MEARQNLLSPLDVVAKRSMDILLSFVLGMLSLPVILLIALLIRLDSPGPIFYSQERLGKDRRKKKRQGQSSGCKIIIYKFRSMQVNADQILYEYLKKNPAARLEWEQNQKLCNDPRITRVGKWIRKFSLDEIPQFFNILKGDMSLVGPRPIMLEQEKMYGDQIEIYTSVRPGLTGFWQVSGRNNTSFSERANYDVYYVRNWSVWLDLYILLRTVWTVLRRDGAY
jgi:Undecaprenyl-phosphate galactose phosphotransferase WbaP